MADDTDVLLSMFEQEWSQARHIEEQRATISNIILLIASAVVGLISQMGLTPDALPLTILLIPLGIYGALTSQKLYERHHFCVDRARLWRKRIDELHPNAQVEKLKHESDTKHESTFRVLEKIKLHVLWNILHLSIAIAGVILTLVIVI